MAPLLFKDQLSHQSLSHMKLVLILLVVALPVTLYPLPSVETRPVPESFDPCVLEDGACSEVVRVGAAISQSVSERADRGLASVRSGAYRACRKAHWLRGAALQRWEAFTWWGLTWYDRALLGLEQSKSGLRRAINAASTAVKGAHREIGHAGLGAAISSRLLPERQCGATATCVCRQNRE
ncbi:hypothetical protein EGW08_014678 [Elysia chlorotica]|uniref:Uncharacterized protein n=1 Tax=Elysia chlorotica TaxID=188477 RepID=A0A433T7Y5_ELYCH|nr:hypothetical protein EGW08_014678 [Elysia chlorotica]